MNNTSVKSRDQLLLLLVIILTGLNLRPFLTGLGPVVSAIRTDTFASAHTIALVTLLPLLCLGAGLILLPGFISRISTKAAMMLGLVLLAAGLILRFYAAKISVLIISSVTCGVAIAAIQYAVPIIIRANFPTRLAKVTGLYTAALMMGGALGPYYSAALISVGITWTAALGSMVLFAIPALLTGSFVTVRQPVRETSLKASPSPIRTRIWGLIIVFGFTNAGYASLAAWLAASVQSLGTSVVESAQYLSVLAITQAAGALAFSQACKSVTSAWRLLLLTLILQGLGFIGLSSGEIYYVLISCISCGLGLGGSFALLIVIAFNEHGSSAASGATVSIMQGGGFMIASISPIITSAIATHQSVHQAWLFNLLLIGIATGITCWLGQPNRRPA